jgi:hypothetical protein
MSDTPTKSAEQADEPAAPTCAEIVPFPHDSVSEEERTAFPHDVCEAALAQLRGDKSVRPYARGDLFERRRALTTAWASYCNASPSLAGATITPLRTASGVS